MLISTIEAKRGAIMEMAHRHGIVSVGVFGSVARGEETAESDVDLLIDMERPVKQPLGFVHFQQEMEALLGRKVDIAFETGLFPAFRDAIAGEVKKL